MQKNILITGSTDGIGLETAKMLVSQGHQVLLHGRNKNKLDKVAESLCGLCPDGSIQSYLADLSDMKAVLAFADEVIATHQKLDVLINNAGIFKSTNTLTRDGLDIRFAVNTIAPFLLTQRLLPIMSRDGRVINLSSAAQSSVNPQAMVKHTSMTDMDAYSQSKLAITLWSAHMAQTSGKEGPAVIAVNPGSLLATKMVKEGFGMDGHDIRIGANILIRAALSDEFKNVSGQYFDNDSGKFALPHADALDNQKSEEIVNFIEQFLAQIIQP